MDYWIPDPDIYIKLQNLKSFVNFVAGLPIASNESKAVVAEIIYLIENINKTSTYKRWNVCLDIYDRDLQNKTNNEAGFIGELGLFTFKWITWKLKLNQNIPRAIRSLWR